MVGRGDEKVEKILRDMLKDLFAADTRGGRREKLARAHGYTDGYMRALQDLGVLSHKQLLAIVLDERRIAAEAPMPRSLGKIDLRRQQVDGAAA